MSYNGDGHRYSNYLQQRTTSNPGVLVGPGEFRFQDAMIMLSEGFTKEIHDDSDCKDSDLRFIVISAQEFNIFSFTNVYHDAVITLNTV